MLRKFIIFTLLLNTIFAQRYSCGRKNALAMVKKSACEFSFKVLDRVALNQGSHFVFSPLSTWLQLAALGEGASGTTFVEIRHLTRQPRKHCLKMKLSRELVRLYHRLNTEFGRSSVMVIDKFLTVKTNYTRDVRKYYKVNVVTPNFKNAEHAAAKINDRISRGTFGIFNDQLDSLDFQVPAIVMGDFNVFRSSWKYPFNKMNTKVEPFYARKPKYDDEPIGSVNMMERTGMYNYIELRFIDAKILEIPTVDDVSLLLFLPIKGSHEDLFYSFRETKLTMIFNTFRIRKEQPVRVKIPRFNINTTVDILPELVYDMGVTRILDPDKADLTKISDSKLYTSWITQSAGIDVAEEGMRASVVAENMIQTTEIKHEFIANRPFGFMVADRRTQFILFAGMYSRPSLY